MNNVVSRVALVSADQVRSTDEIDERIGSPGEPRRPGQGRSGLHGLSARELTAPVRIRSARIDMRDHHSAALILDSAEDGGVSSWSVSM